MTGTRVIAYTPNGARLGPVPTPQELSVGFVLGDVGALTMRYPVDGPRAELLGQPVELAVEVSWDKGLTWQEPPNGRFLYLRDGRDSIQAGDVFAVEAAAYVLRLQKALVGFTGLNLEGVRPFTDATPGAILADLWDEAQARGALAGMTRTWNATQDTAGTPWPTTLSLSYEPGKGILSVLTEFVDQGLVDFRTNGRALELFVADHPSGMGADRTVGALPVTLRFGRDLKEAPFRRTWEALADTALIRGEGTAQAERTNPGAITPWGRQETYVTASGVTDAGTLAVVGDATLALTERERTEHTFGLEFGPTSPLPFRDYAPGEWVYAATDGAGALQRMRVRQITLTRDPDGLTAGNVVLNDRFLEADVLQARKIAGLTQGATQAGTGTSPAGNDILAPAQAVGLAATSAAYVETDGRVRSQISLTWTPVTTNADGTPASDVDHYEIHRRQTGAGPWSVVATSTLPQWSDSPYEPGFTWEFQVRAVDSVFNRGLWSTVASVTTSADSVGPNKPSTPTATTRMGTGRITWDGLRDTGAAMDPDFTYVSVHVSQVNGFTPGDDNRVGELAAAGAAVVFPLDYEATYYAVLLPWDSSGNQGTPSDQVSFAVAPLVDVSNFPDDAMDDLYARTGHFITVTSDMIEANAVTADKVLAGSLESYHLKVTDRRPNMLTNGWMEEATAGNADGWGLVFPDGTVTLEDAPAPITGARSQRITFAAASAITYGYQGGFLPCYGGQRVSVRCLVRPTVDLGAGNEIILRVHSSTPAKTPYDLFDPDALWADAATLTGPTVAGQAYLLEGVVTIPAGHTLMATSLSNDPLGSAWALDIDAWELFPGTGDENITEVSAGKIRTGVLQASERIVAGSLTGARAELNGTGFQAFDPSGAKTFEVLGASGEGYFAGSVTTRATGANGRVEISAVNNPYQSNQLWGSVLFHSDEPSWDPGVLWAVYDDSGATNWGELDLFGPRLGVREPARVRLRSEEQTNQTLILLEANEIQTMAEVHRLGDPGQDVVTIRQNYTGASTDQGFSFQSPGGKRITFKFGLAGQNRVQSLESDGTTWERLDIDAETIFLNSRDADGELQVLAASQQADRIALGCPDGNSSLVFSSGGRVRVMTLNGSAYGPLSASEFAVNSDERTKLDPVLVPPGALDLVKALPVYDYRTRLGHGRGIMAQDLRRLLPTAVIADDDGSLSVDLYALVATLIAGVQELAAEVGTLTRRP